MEDDVLALLADVLAKKSTATLKKRAGSLLLFLKWAQDSASASLAEMNELQMGVLSIGEDAAYDYLSFLRRTAPPASRGQSFVEAANFIEGVFGFDASGCKE